MKIYKNVIKKDSNSKPLVGRVAGRQSIEIPVRFPKPFSQIPYVQISIERMDTGGFIEPSPFKQNNERIYQTVTRYDAAVCNISETGFSLKVATWGGSVIYGFRIGWLAIGEQKEEERLTIKDLLNALYEQKASE